MGMLKRSRMQLEDITRLVLILAVQLFAFGCSAISLPNCEGLKIGIMSLNDLAPAAGVERCSLDTVHVRADNGIVYTTKTALPDSSPHNIGTHSAPWYLKSAIQSSKYYTPDLMEADIIFVDDYCQYINWLAAVHSMHYKIDDSAPSQGDALVKLYEEMMKHPAWLKSQGGHFALYDSHPGFFQGKASEIISDMRCNAWQDTIQLIMDTPMRNSCPNFWQIKKILITPYVPNPLEDRDPRSYLHLSHRPLADRQILGHARLTCWPPLPGAVNIGKLMRLVFGYEEWGRDPDFDVRCTDKNATMSLSDVGVSTYEEMFRKMRSSIFCPVLPGDSASTRRLSEIFLAGCIPVFLGPPYHSMPFAETIPYKDVAIFFNISDPKPWMQDVSPEFHLDPLIRSVHPSEAKWWVPEADVYDSMIQVQKAADVLPRLKAIPPDQLEQKLLLLHEYGTRFTFVQRLTQPPSAANSLMAAMCMKQRQYPSDHTLAEKPLTAIHSP